MGTGARIETSDKVTAAIVRMYLAAVPALDEALKRCESPIEQMFLVALFGACEDSEGVYFGEYGATKYSRSQMAYALSPLDIDDVIVSNDDASFSVAQQHVIELDGRRLRPDFSMVTMGVVLDDAPPIIAAKIAIELDGHEWHERSKEQARVDKSRDRALSAAGWHVLRFTGSEVYGDALGCVTESVRVAAEITARRRDELVSLGKNPKRLAPNFPRLEGVRR